MNILIAFTFLVFAVWRLLPLTVFCFYPDKISASFVSPRSDKPPTQSGKIKQLTSVLTEIGFIPLGTKVEKLPLWAEKLYELNLYSIEECCFASIPMRKSGSLYYFYTVFNDGGVVLTANAGFSMCQEFNYVITIVRSIDPRDILEVHRMKVQQLREAGQCPLETFTKESRIQATNAFYAAPTTRRRMRPYGLLNLFLTVLCLFLAIMILL